MGKKKYVRPDIREESRILTVEAWVTKTQYVLANPTTTSSYALVESVQAVSETSYFLLNRITGSNVALQTVITRVNYALQNVLTRLAERA